MKLDISEIWELKAKYDIDFVEGKILSIAEETCIIFYRNTGVLSSKQIKRLKEKSSISPSMDGRIDSLVGQKNQEHFWNKRMRNER